MTSTTATDAAQAMFVSSCRIEALDLHGVPYQVLPADDGPLHRLVSASGRSASWPSAQGAAHEPAMLGGIPIFAPVLSDDDVDAFLRPHGGGWETCAVITDTSGAAISSVRRSGDGSVFLPFDPNRAASVLLREEYLALTSSGRARVAKSVARRAYYRARPLLPRAVQLALRRRFTDVQQRSSFPDWPTETALHDLREWFLALVQELAGHPLPQIGLWPGNTQWALVLTHDVERAAGYEIIDEVAELESRVGLRSAWYFVPERDYDVDERLLDRLRADRFEICVHGLHHDGRDLQPGVFEKRLPAMRSYAERWRATGFRAPSTQRSPELIGRLGFDHDSSYSDVARFEPQGGGSCSWLPFFIDDVVELPITLPMDHTLFELLGHGDEAFWVEKAEFLRERRGMALMLTHPDYLRDGLTRRAYEAFLDRVAHDDTVWHALPSEVSAWWRRRAVSRLCRGADGWVVEGPAAPDACVTAGDRPSPFRVG